MAGLNTYTTCIQIQAIVWYIWSNDWNKRIAIWNSVESDSEKERERERKEKNLHYIHQWKTSFIHPSIYLYVNTLVFNVSKQKWIGINCQLHEWIYIYIYISVPCRISLKKSTFCDGQNNIYIHKHIYSKRPRTWNCYYI